MLSDEETSNVNIKLDVKLCVLLLITTITVTIYPKCACWAEQTPALV